MSGRAVYCGDTAVSVRRWLRPHIEITAGSMVPFMVSKDDAQFVRDHEGEPFVLRTLTERWSLEINSVESTGTEGVWVSAKAVSRISDRPSIPAPQREHRGTLMGLPVPDPTELDPPLPEGDAGATAPLGLEFLTRDDE